MKKLLLFLLHWTNYNKYCSILYLLSDGIKWSIGNALWSSIWCQNLQTVGSLSTNMLPNFFHCLYYHIHPMVLHWAHPYPASSRSWCCRLCCPLRQVPHSWLICLWFCTKLNEVLSGTRHYLSFGPLLRNPIWHSFRDSIPFGSSNNHGIDRSSLGSFNFNMDIISFVSILCHLLQEIRQNLERVFVWIISLLFHNLETSHTLCSNGVVS